MIRPVFFLSIVSLLLVSCGSSSHTGNSYDDAYYSGKPGKANTVLIKEVNIDSIIKVHPPQYGPTNSIEQVTPNPNAAAGYPAYKAKQDSLYRLYPWLSGYYVATTPPPFDEREAAKEARQARKRLNRYYRNNSYYTPYYYNNWDVGLGYGGYYGFNNWNYGGGWNNFYNGWNPYLGWNSFSPFGYNPYYGGFRNWNRWNHIRHHDARQQAGPSSSPAIQRPQTPVGGSSPSLGNGPGNNSRMSSPSPIQRSPR